MNKAETYKESKFGRKENMSSWSLWRLFDFKVLYKEKKKKKMYEIWKGR